MPSATRGLSLHTQLKMRLNYRRRSDGNIFDVRCRDTAAASSGSSPICLGVGVDGGMLKENALEPKHQSSPEMVYASEHRV